MSTAEPRRPPHPPFFHSCGALTWVKRHISRLLHYISLPVIADAPLLPSPSPDFRLPTMVFSHGLGGTRLAYSHICCSIASYGVVVVAPEHRDGSAPVSFVRTSATGAQETQIQGTKPSSNEPGIGEASAATSSSPENGSNGRIQVDYATYPHHISEETANGRNRQLEIRLREVALVYSALASLDAGRIPADTIVSTDETPDGTTGVALLGTLKDRLDIHEPGRVIWAGHSFGASTMFQFIKSIHHIPPRSSTTHKPLFTPECIDTNPTIPTLPLQQQVTPDSPLLLLDLWCLPLLGQRTNYLFKQPLPQISADNPRKILVVMSDEFWRWKENLHGIRRALSADPGRKRGGDANRWFEQWDDGDGDGDDAHRGGAAPDVGAEGPRFYYVHKSAHLSQSDFGILFPRAIKGADGAERILDLNVRAVVQWLREAGVRLGGVGEEVGGGIFGGKVEGWSKIALEEEEFEVKKTG